MELKQILQRQPGPEVAEQLQIYQQTLKEKTKQMKVHIIIQRLFLYTWHPTVPYKVQCYVVDIHFELVITQSMASELNMYESQVTEHKMDIDRLQRELQEVKKKYYLQKKKEHHNK